MKQLIPAVIFAYPYTKLFLKKGIKNAKIQKILKVSAVHVRIGLMEEDIDGEYCKAGIADDFQY